MQHSICTAHNELLTLTSLQCSQEDNNRVLQDLQNTNKEKKPIKRILSSVIPSPPTLTLYTRHKEFSRFKWFLTFFVLN